MKTKTFFLSIILLLSFTSSLHAQAVERYLRSKARVATNRASDRADDEVDSQINKAVDREFDKLLNKNEGEEEETITESENVSTGEESSKGSQKSSSSSESARSKAFLKSLGLDAPVNVSESYNYKGYIQMGIKNWDSEGNEETQTMYNTYFNENTGSFAMEFSEPDKEKSVIIFDSENKLMIILADDGNEKTGIVTPLNYDEQGADSTYDQGTISEGNTDTDFNWQNPNYKKTGRNKTVSGYSCEEYLYDDEESELSLWITKDLPADLYTKMFSLSTFSTLSYTGYGQGFTMEWDMKKKNSKERSTMTVKDVNKNKETNIKTSGYNLINMGGLLQQE